MNQYEGQIRNLYLGILNNYPEFAEEDDAHLEYDFAAPEFEELRSAYNLDNIAGNGTASERAERLLHYFAPRLKHESFYDNHVECSAMKLLTYSFENDEHGINCLNKSKILAECCLALGIFARRVFIHPFSPFDFDSHVVCEIFDEQRGKWIMLDPTTDSYFVNEDNVPLSMYEIRTNYLNSEFLTLVSADDKDADLRKAAEKNESINLYFLKNCFRISFETYNGFGERKGLVCLVPEHYPVCRNEELNHRFRVENMPEEYRYLLDAQEKYLEKTNHTEEPTAYSVRSVYAAPERKS